MNVVIIIPIWSMQFLELIINMKSKPNRIIFVFVYTLPNSQVGLIILEVKFMSIWSVEQLSWI